MNNGGVAHPKVILSWPAKNRLRKTGVRISLKRVEGRKGRGAQGKVPGVEVAAWDGEVWTDVRKKRSVGTG